MDPILRAAETGAKAPVEEKLRSSKTTAELNLKKL